MANPLTAQEMEEVSNRIRNEFPDIRFDVDPRGYISVRRIDMGQTSRFVLAFASEIKQNAILGLTVGACKDLLE